jgi:hypothetical protein
MRLAAPTESQADESRTRVFRFCLAHGMTHADADDAAQATVLKALTREWKTLPNDLSHGVNRILRQARMYGAWSLLPGNTSRRRREGLETPPVRDTAPPYADPAVAAEMADRYAGPDRKKAAARAGVSPAVFTLHAMGWGPLDDEDAAKATSTNGSGPGYTPPARGCPGMATASDPNPQRTATLRTVAPVALEGDNLTAYRAELASHYAR